MEVDSVVDSLLNRMTLEEKLGQLFMVGFSGTEPDAGIREWIERCHLGNVVLFAGNMVDPPQVLRLTGELQALARKAQEAGQGQETGKPQEASTPIASRGNGFVPLFIAADQEGGIVVRLTRGATVFPGNMALGATRDPELARRAAAVMGYEMRAVGIQFNLAPVLDVNCNPRNPVIGVRSYGEDPELVAELGAAQIEGYQQFVVATAKHFPGHGDTAVDSHLARPVVGHGRERLWTVELLPFRRAIAAGVGAIMTAHLSVPAIEPDPRLPATLSRRVVTGLLREELGYDGIIITDSLGMRGVSAEYDMVEASLLALEAGCDMLCASSHTYYGTFVYDAVLAAVRAGRISAERIEESARRVLRAKARFGLLEEGGLAQGCGRAGAWTLSEAWARAGVRAEAGAWAKAGESAKARESVGPGERTGSDERTGSADGAVAEVKAGGQAAGEGQGGGGAGYGASTWQGDVVTLAEVGSPAHWAVAREVARRAITQVKGPAALPAGTETVIVIEFSAQAQTGVEDLRLERGTVQGQAQGQAQGLAGGVAQTQAHGQAQVRARDVVEVPAQNLAASPVQGPAPGVVQGPVQSPVRGVSQPPAQAQAQAQAQTQTQSQTQTQTQTQVQAPAQANVQNAQTGEGGPLAAALQELLRQQQSPARAGMQVLSLVLPLNPGPDLRQRLLAQVETFRRSEAGKKVSVDQPGREKNLAPGASAGETVPAVPAGLAPDTPASGKTPGGVAAVVAVVATLDAVRNAGQADLIRELTTSGIPVWVVSLRNPYELSSLGEAAEKASFLVAYSPQAVSLAAAAEVLTGVLTPSGRLPVTLP